MMKEIMMPGPAKFAAARPVRTKMPVPMMQPMPSRTRLSAPRLRLRSPWACSACICATDLRMKRRRRPVARPGALDGT